MYNIKAIYNKRYEPIMSADVVVFRPDLKVIEDKGDLLVGRSQEEIGAIRVARIIAWVSRRVELAALARDAPIGEGTAAVGGCSSWYPVFRLERVPCNEVSLF